MAKIFMSMAGEGRGHATRIRALVEQLREDHEIALFAPEEAYRMLAPIYEGTDVRIVRIPGLVFHYNPNNRLDFSRTAMGAMRYLGGMAGLVRRLAGEIRRERPDLIVTDFEPALPRAAKRCNVPFVSVNHQHFLLINDLSELPAYLRRHAALMSLVVRAYYGGQAATVVSQFYFPPIKPRWQGRATLAGVLMRPEVLNAQRILGDHVCVYLRKFASENVLNALKTCGREVRIYGLGELPDDENLRFRPISNRRFLKDLASCQALISTAGNQLVGEALYLGKPVLALPEPNNYEQYINAFYLKKSGAGDWTEMETVTPEQVQHFLARLEIFHESIRPERLNGNQAALRVLARQLDARASSEELARRPQPVGELAHW